VAAPNLHLPKRELRFQHARHREKHTEKLAIEVQYRLGIAWVKFVGTHEQYDRIDVETVSEY
jgi:hypothetical protein